MAVPTQKLLRVTKTLPLEIIATTHEVFLWAHNRFYQFPSPPFFSLTLSLSRLRRRAACGETPPRRQGHAGQGSVSRPWRTWGRRGEERGRGEGVYPRAGEPAWRGHPAGPRAIAPTREGRGMDGHGELGGPHKTRQIDWHALNPICRTYTGDKQSSMPLHLVLYKIHRPIFAATLP
ncbi:hypothetical protein C2845_PM18G04820 [Panicum miliaceum]|uniref:Uncharacterized protein n=1 Tax=Panicum miliaceum TaxID=4540 RepID=A0A3L6PKQ6_PANMI|nr:hypothetical protein C2845_PM18G04820 [Panicum miliaceum]